MKKTAFARAAVAAAALSMLLAGCSKSPDAEGPAPADASEVPVGRLGAVVAPSHYRLGLRVDPREERFSGTTSIDVTLGESVDEIYLHGKGLDVTEAWVDAGGERIDASYEQVDDSGVARLTLTGDAAAGDATLNFVYEAPFNTSTNALFRIERDGEFYAASQMQPIGARQVFPGFDEPAFKVPFELTLTTRSDDVAITTTPEAGVEDLGDGFVERRFVTTRPMPTYLLAFAVGPYDVVDYGTLPPNSIRDRELPLRGIASKGLGPRMEYALANTEGLLTVLEEYFGTEYPYRKLDLIAVPESFGGAMENIGAVVYDEYLMLMDENSPLEQRRIYTYVHAHELAHMWFGNLVTPEWWNDIWLNESFATWMMYKAADGYWPEGEFDRETMKGALGAMNNDSLAAARQIREPIDNSNRIASAFDGITYQKGGGVLAMLERYVGEEDFRKGVQLHMSRHNDRTATAEEFIASIAEGSDRAEIEGAFTTFIQQAGVPLLTVNVDCGDESSPELIVGQQRYAPLGSSIDPLSAEWQIPMCVRYSADGDVRSSCSLLAERTQRIALEASSCPDWVHPNADGAGYYRFAMDDAGWQALIDVAAQLSASEALVLADSLDAALRAGEVSAETYVAGMSALFGHEAWDVVDSVTNYLELLTDIVDFPNLPPVFAAYSSLANPVFADLDNRSGAGADLLRTRLLRFLIVIARDQALRAPLAAQAAARLGMDGEPDPDAVAPGELETVFSVGVQDLGEPFFDKLFEAALAADDPAFRGAATGALARVEDPPLVAKLQDAVLAGSFDGVEATGIIFRQMVRAATTDLTYNWVRDNYDEVAAIIPETFRANVIP
ncbi:MAG: M1 family metallopeptidase, partial [Pseudomonadota bacterium]